MEKKGNSYFNKKLNFRLDIEQTRYDGRTQWHIYVHNLNLNYLGKNYIHKIFSSSRVKNPKIKAIEFANNYMKKK